MNDVVIGHEAVSTSQPISLHRINPPEREPFVLTTKKLQFTYVVDRRWEVVLQCLLEQPTDC